MERRDENIITPLFLWRGGDVRNCLRTGLEFLAPPLYSRRIELLNELDKSSSRLTMQDY